MTLTVEQPPAAETDLENEWRTGWRIVAGAAIGMGTGIGLYLVVRSLFVVHLTKEFGWTRGDLGVAGTVAFVTGALVLPVIGRIVDRFGYRRVVLVCVPAMSLLYLAIALQPGPFRIHLLLMVWGGIFGGGTAAISYTRPLIAAFHRQRGLALGLATAGTSITAMIVPPIIAAVIAHYGWRAGLYTMAAITTLVGLPLSLALIGNPTAASQARSLALARARGPRGAALRDALRTPRFWLLAVAFAAVNIPGAGVVAQLAPMLGDKGLPEETAALVMSVYAAGLLLGRLMTGFSLDRMPTALVAAPMTLIPAIGIVLLRANTLSFATASAAVLMLGLQQGSEIDLIAYIVSRSFGVEHYGTIYGALGVAGAVSTAASFVFFGKVHDLTGSYDIALTVGALAFGVGAIAFTAVGGRPAAIGERSR
jgi:sugar phosphate permease